MVYHFACSFCVSVACCVFVRTSIIAGDAGFDACQAMWWMWCWVVIVVLGCTDYITDPNLFFSVVE